MHPFQPPTPPPTPHPNSNPPNHHIISSQAPHSHIPYGDAGSGHYSDNTIGCYDVMQECAALVLNAIRSTPIKAGHVFTIADYGCADGGTSMPLWYACVKELKEKHGSEFPIHVMYEDQPVNDFKSLFLRLQGESGPTAVVLWKTKISYH